MRHNCLCACLVDRENIIIEHRRRMPTFDDLPQLCFHSFNRLIAYNPIPDHTIAPALAEGAGHHTTSRCEKCRCAMLATSTVFQECGIAFIPTAHGRENPVEFSERDIGTRQTYI